MAASSAAKLNMKYSFFPVAFLAKQSEEQGDVVPAFKPIGQKRLSANQLALLTVIEKMRMSFGYAGRITHAMVEKILHISHTTVNHNLAKLRNYNVIQREADSVNVYSLNPDIEFNSKPYIILYDFLFDTIGFGKYVKKLNFNPILLVHYMINHYFEVADREAEKGNYNIKPDEAYFVGGKQRVASLLNIAESTANDAVWELLDTKCIYRKALYVDAKGNEVISNGKGNSKNKQTVYVLNSKLVRLCKKIRKQIIKQNSPAPEANASDAAPAPEQASSNTTCKMPKYRRARKKRARKSESVVDEAYRAMQRAAARDALEGINGNDQPGESETEKCLRTLQNMKDKDRPPNGNNT